MARLVQRQTEIAPDGMWNWAARVVSWANGTDIGSGSARIMTWRVIALHKIAGQFVGDRTGYLGYGWNNDRL